MKQKILHCFRRLLLYCTSFSILLGTYPAISSQNKAHLYWEGSLAGKFIGDTSQTKATKLFVPTCQIDFSIYIAGTMAKDGIFTGGYSATFEPALKTIDISKAEEVKEWSVQPENSVNATGKVSGNAYLLNNQKKRSPFTQKILDAFAHIIEQWKNTTHVQHGSLEGPQGTLPPGSLTGRIDDQELSKLLKDALSSEASDDALDLISQELSQEVNDYLDGYTTQLQYPQAASYIGPELPPTSNVPQTLSQGSTSNSFSTEDLSTSLQEKTDLDKETIRELTETISEEWEKFIANTQLIDVKGSGPIPSFSPPMTPMGPVSHGTLQGGRAVGPKLGADTTNDNDMTITLLFHDIPTSINVTIKAAFSLGKKGGTANKTQTVPLGNGYFSPQAKIYQKEFSGPVTRKNDQFFCNADINKEASKPSPMQDGIIKEIAQTKLTLYTLSAGQLPSEKFLKTLHFSSANQQ